MKTVIEKVERLYPYDLEGDVDDLINKLENFNLRYPDKKLRISQGYGHGDETWFDITYQRPENKEEKRIRREREKSSLEAERKHYEFLKRKFGK